MAAALARSQILHPSLILKQPSTLFPKRPQPSPVFSSVVSINLHRYRFRRLCSGFSSPSSSSESSCNKSIGSDLLDYLNESWTQFHATTEAKKQLLAAGFQLLNENDEWNLKPGGRYFFTRYSIGNGFHVIAAHTDSPCLKLKPISSSSNVVI